MLSTLTLDNNIPTKQIFGEEKNTMLNVKENIKSIKNNTHLEMCTGNDMSVTFPYCSSNCFISAHSHRVSNFNRECIY